jgi:hypothetical protein
MTHSHHASWWKWLLVAYLALSGLSLLIGENHDKLPAAVLQPLFVLLGPTAWLLWGSAATPVYIVATMVLVAFVTGAMFVQIHAPVVGRLALWFSGLGWFLLGLWAWSFNV